jgi:predicted ATPase/DNA-binding SARP family transcriptional activator
VEIGILGALVCHDRDRAVEVSGDRVRRLACRLVADAGRAVTLGELVDAVWPDDPPGNTPNALQSLVSRLRRALGAAEIVQQTPQGYRLNIDSGQVDANCFLDLARSGRDQLRAGHAEEAARTLRSALGLWRGRLLDDAGEAEYAVALRVRWDEQRLQAVTDRIEADIARGMSGDLVAEIEQLVADHPLHEALVALQMRAMTAAGRPSEALAAYERLRERLADELGADPSASLQELHVALLRGEAVAPTAARVGATNLPAALSSFVGREAELERVSRLLEQSRLVTVVGPGGAGKTRLAIEAASTRRPQLPDGVWLVDLAPAADADAVVSAFLGALGLREVQVLERGGERLPSSARERLLQRLAESRTLLLVDNCEHVIDLIADLIGEILAASPHVGVLATSREPLAIVGEALCVLSPLAMPDEGSTVDAAIERPSVQLFVQRAEAVDAAFALDESNVDAVVGIVRRLDGLPLAIELAAARLRVLPVSEILDRLTDRFRLLTGGSRTAMPRHRTLRAVVEWSWELLSVAERLLVERLAVFPSGATVESASVVCADDDLDARDIHDLLSQLVEKSLLKATDDHGLRYRMLETIREYGVEQLAERAEVDAVRSAHAAYFTRLAERLDPVLRTADQLDALTTLTIERENLLAAVRFLGDRGDAGGAVRLVLALCWYWTMLGDHDEAQTWLRYSRGVDSQRHGLREAAADAVLSISALGASEAHGPSSWADAMDEIRRANAALEEYEPIAISLIGVLRPMLAFFSGEYDLADRLTERALSSDDPWIRAAARTFRAAVWENAGQPERMRADVSGSLDELENIGDRWLLGSTLSIRARVRTLDGDLDGAIADFEAAGRFLSEIGAADDQTFIGLRLTELKLRVGDVVGAREQLARAFEDASVQAMPYSLLKTAMTAAIARYIGDEDEARRLGLEMRSLVSGLSNDHPLQGHARAIVMSGLALFDIDARELGRARVELDEAYAVALTTHDMPVVASVGVAIAALGAAAGDHAVAAEILGAAASLRGARDETDLEISRLARRLRKRLGAAPFDECFGRGEAMSHEDAQKRLDPATLVVEPSRPRS